MSNSIRPREMAFNSCKPPGRSRRTNSSFKMDYEDGCQDPDRPSAGALCTKLPDSPTLSKQVTFGFYDKKLPDPEEVRRQLVCTESCELLTKFHQVGQLDSASVTDPEVTSSGIKEETPVQRHSQRLESRRGNASEPPNLNAGPDPPSQPFQSIMDDRPSARSSQISRSSKRLITDYVLTTTLPSRLHRKSVPSDARTTVRK